MLNAKLNKMSEVEVYEVASFYAHFDIVKKGELVGFTPYSEFEFIVGDKRLYRIKLNDISIKYEHKGTEKLYNTSWL